MVRTGSRQTDRRVLLLGVRRLCSVLAVRKPLVCTCWGSQDTKVLVPLGLTGLEDKRSSVHTAWLGLLRVSSVYFCQSSGKIHLSVLSCLHFSAG